MKTLKVKRNVFIAFAAIALVSCLPDQKKPSKEEQMSDVNKAVCMLYPTENSEVFGTVTFTKTLKGVHIVAKVEGLTEGKHGFHIHEFGDCSAEDASSAGGHYNPTGEPHGAPTDKGRHEGDLGNITANAEGVAVLDTTDAKLFLTGEYSIIGRSVVVHAGADDLKSQPSGAAGARVACGVIGIATTDE